MTTEGGTGLWNARWFNVSEFLDAALLYASKGWRVFPLRPRSKNPATKHGFKDATADESTIRRWWSENPEYNVGIATGRGLCVVDVDDKEKNAVQGSDALRDWEYENGRISDTVTAISGTGGTHYYFDVGKTAVPSCQSDTIFIDLRCEGGYIVAPPSIHPDTGEPYMWDVSPEDMEPAPANATDKACIDWIYRSRKGAKPDGTAEKPTAGSVKEGEGRNNHLYKMGCSVRGQGFTDAQVEAYLRFVNAQDCDPPLGRDELDRIVQSVCGKPVGMSEEAKEAKKSAGRPRKFSHNEVGKRLIDERGACLIDGETPAIRTDDGSYQIGWGAFDSVIIDMHDDCTMTNRREVKAYVKSKAPKVRQAPANLVAFENGILDVNTMQLRPWQPADIISNIIPHRWNPDAHSDAVDATFEKIACGDVGMEMNLAEIIGLCMMRSSKFGYCPILLGTGSNGKSTYIDMVWNVLGDENVSALQPREIGVRFQAGQLAGKLANLGDDISSDYIDADSCSIIKKVATGSQLYTDVKGSDGFKFKPYCTMVFSANEFPRLGDNTYGMYRRLFPLRFNAVFRREDPDFDPDIGDKLKDEESIEYLCVLGVEGLRRVIAQSSLTPNDESRKILADIEVDNSTVVQWIVSGDLAAESVIGRTAQEVYSDYKEWCQDNGVSFVGSRKFNGTLAARWHVTPAEMGHGYRHGRRVTMRIFREQG